MLKVMKRDFAKFYYVGNEYKTFHEYKGKEHDLHCRKFIEWEKPSKWED